MVTGGNGESELLKSIDSLLEQFEALEEGETIESAPPTPPQPHVPRTVADRGSVGGDLPDLSDLDVSNMFAGYELDSADTESIEGTESVEDTESVEVAGEPSDLGESSDGVPVFGSVDGSDSVFGDSHTDSYADDDEDDVVDDDVEPDDDYMSNFLPDYELTKENTDAGESGFAPDMFDDDTDSADYTEHTDPTDTIEHTEHAGDIKDTVDDSEHEGSEDTGEHGQSDETPKPERKGLVNKILSQIKSELKTSKNGDNSDENNPKTDNTPPQKETRAGGAKEQNGEKRNLIDKVVDGFANIRDSIKDELKQQNVKNSNYVEKDDNDNEDTSAERQQEKPAKKTKKNRKQLFIVKLYNKIAQGIFKAIYSVFSILAVIPLIGKIFKPIAALVKKLEKFAGILPVILVVGALGWSIYSSVPQVSNVEMPDNGNVTATNFSYKDGKAGATIINTGDVALDDLTVKLKVYTYQPGLSIRSLTKYTPKATCSDIHIQRLEMVSKTDVQIQCKYSGGYLPRVTGTVE